tara:strand:- start:3938 stop:4123 length:186 start_codon:yes stop_codon:yes gene_type:complete
LVRVEATSRCQRDSRHAYIEPTYTSQRRATELVAYHTDTPMGRLRERLQPRQTELAKTTDA